MGKNAAYSSSRMATIDGPALSTSWLSTKLGIDTVLINTRRRHGELFAIRSEGASEWRFPAWQFDEDCRVKSDVARVLAAARERGLDSERLNTVLQRRSGITGGGTLLDSLLSGRVDHVVATINAA